MARKVRASLQLITDPQENRSGRKQSDRGKDKSRRPARPFFKPLLISNPMPIPSAARVIAINPSSGKVRVIFFEVILILHDSR
jgi:hypothetical protein